MGTKNNESQNYDSVVAKVPRLIFRHFYKTFINNIQ